MPDGAPDILRVEGIFHNGFGLIPKAVMHDRELTLESKAIYAYLCSLAGSGEQAFPYRETMLRHLRMAKNTYYRHYNPLIEQGYLRVERPDDKKSANIYTLVQNPKKLMTSTPRGLSGKLRYKGLKAQGYGALPRAVMMDDRLSVKAKGLYAYFCSYCGSGDCAFPRKDHILYHLSVTDPTYYKSLGQLREFGYLSTVQRKDSGRFDVNDYYLNEFPDQLSPNSKNCDIEICDIEICDAKKCDAIIITKPNNNSFNNNSLSIIDRKRDNGLFKLAKELAPDIEEDKLQDFVERFGKSAKGKKVRNLRAYMRTSLQSWIVEQDAMRDLNRSPTDTHNMGQMQKVIENLGIW